MDSYKIYRKYLCIDLKSFYASVECLDRGLDIFKTALVVTDISRGDGAITLAATPFMKDKYKISSRERLYNIPKGDDIIYARPRMKRYMEVSSEVISTYLDFVSLNDIHIYSIDECFLDVTDYLSYYNMTSYELAIEIMSRVKLNTGIISTCGIGDNMLLSKFALDIDSKYSKDNIAVWNYSSVYSKLWPLTDFTKMWGIGSKVSKKFKLFGCNTLEDVANLGIDFLKKQFGVLGEEIYFHLHGIDQSDLRKKYVVKNKRISLGQTLFKDFNSKDILIILREMCDSLTRRLRYLKKSTSLVHLSLGYSKFKGGGFSRQMTINKTIDNNVLYDYFIMLFNKFIENKPIRKLSLSFGKLEDENKLVYSLFDDVVALEKNKKLQSAIDKITNKFGKNSLMRAVSFTDKGNQRKRNKLVGGHNAE